MAPAEAQTRGAADGAFDLVLCAHLLFLYSRQFDFDWHLRSCRELIRVGGGEVRIHPICRLDGKPYPELDRLLGELRREAIFGRIIPVDYEFFAGSDTTLVLRRGDDPNPPGNLREANLAG